MTYVSSYMEILSPPQSHRAANYIPALSITNLWSFEMRPDTHNRTTVILIKGTNNLFDRAMGVGDGSGPQRPALLSSRGRVTSKARDEVPHQIVT